MRPLTIILAYYENPTMLVHQLANLAAMDQELRDKLRLIIVDDGSPRNPALEVLNDFPRPVDTKLFRMEVDVPWNQDACRNLGVSQTEDDDWLLLTDMDHVAPEKTVRSIMTRKLAADRFYTLARVSAPTMETYKPHPNSYVMRKATYDLAGGYDERWAGVYGTDGAFRSRLNLIATVGTIKEPLIRYGREVVPDASTTQYERKTEQNAVLRAERGIKIREEGGPPQRGLFPWVRQI